MRCSPTRRHWTPPSQPLQDAFRAIGRRPMEVAATLRASPLDRFFTVAVPMVRPAFLTAAVLGFAHTIGEFGVVLMLQYTNAHWLSGGLLIMSFLMLITVYAINRRFRMVRP